MPFIKIIAIIILLLLFAEDMQFRAIHWFWFPVLLVVLLTLKLADNRYQFNLGMATSAASNVSFVWVQLLLVTVYFSIKERRLVNITIGLLGWGDIFFLMTVAFYLSFLNFIIFYIISLFMVLGGWLVYIFVKKNRQHHIPLAGLQSLLLASLLLVSCFKPEFDLTSDDLLIYLIN